MRIVYCIPSTYKSGGIERVLSIKANYLADVWGYDVHIVTTSQNNQKPFYPFSSRITFHDLDINYDIEQKPLYKQVIQRIKKIRKHKKELARLLSAVNADIVISMFTHEMRFLYKINDGSKKILELHFSKYYKELHAQYNNYSFLKLSITKLLSRLDFNYCKKYDAFVVLTEEDKNAWVGYKNIFVISNPIPFQIKEATDPTSRNIIAVGRLCKQKGFDLLLQAWNMIDIEDRKEWSLSIYGQGPNKEELDDYIKLHDLYDVTIHKPVNYIKSVYLDASIIAFSSRYEGLPMVLLESMALGVIPISFKCPCGPRDIIVDGKNGILIDCFNVAEFAKKLKLIMNDTAYRSELSKQAHQSIKAQYEVDKIMPKWKSLFETLTSKVEHH